MRIFYYGFDHVSTKDFDLLVKLDADLELPLNYFKETAKAMRLNPKNWYMCRILYSTH